MQILSLLFESLLVLAEINDKFDETLSSFRNAFTGSTKGNIIQWGVVLFMILGAVTLAVMTAKLWKYAHRQEQQDKGPEELFEGLLGVLKLGETDKKLLREMAEGSRLRHPATSLLSPKTLDWSRQVWRDEMGTRKSKRLKVQAYRSYLRTAF